LSWGPGGENEPVRLPVLPLTRYFPELVTAAIAELPESAA
jgi:hypothetical protein